MDGRILTGQLALLATPLSPRVPVEVVLPLEGDYDIAILVRVRANRIITPQAEIVRVPDRVKE